MSTYDQLFALCEHHIVAYRDDLVKHDKAWLEDHPGIPFLHFTRDYGTHLIALFPADSPTWPAPGVVVPYLFGTADREHILRETVTACDYCTDNSPHLLTMHFDGKKFHHITDQNTKDIAIDYTRRVEHAWKTARRAIA